MGHACEMIEDTAMGMLISAAKVPVFRDTLEMAEIGMVPGGLYRNRDFRKPWVHIAKEVDQFLADVLFDPQTSGGLLISVAPDKADLLLQKLHQSGVSRAAVIGEIISEPAGKILVQA
jgi:selenide,water dikinase